MLKPGCPPKPLLLLSRLLISTLLFASVAGFLCGCSGSANRTTADLLPSRTDAGLERYADVVTFTDSDLDLYLGASAAIYRKHGVIEATTAGYSNGETELAVDVIRFDTDSNARRLYVTIRPPDSDTSNLGDMGNLDPGKLTFVRGACMVRITACEDNDTTRKLMRELGRAVLARISGMKANSAA